MIEIKEKPGRQIITTHFINIFHVLNSEYAVGKITQQVL
jgi:hypothetical protein